MNNEPLRFIPGPIARIVSTEEADSYEAQIHVVGRDVWLARICVYGLNEDDANGLRERVLWGLQQQTVPTVWQWFGPDGWTDINAGSSLDNGGEAARLKGEGYEIRALYAKQPLKEV